MKPMLAGKAPGARRLKVADKDDCLQDVYATLLRCRDAREGCDCLYDLQADVLLILSTTMSEADATDDPQARGDLDVDSIVMIPSMMM